MTTTEVATKLVEMCRKGEFKQAAKTLYAQDIVSVEPMAMPPMPAETRGLAAVLAKGEWWTSNHEIHGMKVGDPFVAGDRFAVQFDMDITNKPSGKRMQGQEIGLYTVANGKIVREDFMYNAAGKGHA